jgi:hypothetical protein
MTVIELIPRLLHDDVRVRLLAVELARTNGNRAVTNCIVNNLVRRLSIQNAQRRLYAAEALVCLGGVAVNQVTYRLLKSRSPSLQIKLAAILGEMALYVEPNFRLQIFQDLQITASRTRNSAVISACLNAMARIRWPTSNNYEQKENTGLASPYLIPQSEPSPTFTLNS